MVDDTSRPMTPAQERAWRDLLAVGTPRPRTHPTLAGALAERVASETADAAALVPPGERLWLNKTALAALDCDGRFLDREDMPFTWSPALVRGQLAHTVIEVDTEGGRRREADEVVDFAWTDLADRGGGAGALLAQLGGPEADALRAGVRRRLLAFRECFPLLPPEAHARTQAAFTVSLHDGRIVLKGVPDLVVGRATATHRRMQIIDFKTGVRGDGDRDDVRFYALLATLKLGVAPFRVATYYLDEADWAHEDVDESVLEAAVRALVPKIHRAARLAFHRPREDALRLTPGAGCRWCSRAPRCLARLRAVDGGAPARTGAEHPDAA